MSHWNHRVIETKTPEGPWLAIHEVHYEHDGRPYGYTAEPIGVCGENKAELLETLDRMRAAVKMPILRPADFEKPKDQK